MGTIAKKVTRGIRNILSTTIEYLQKRFVYRLVLLLSIFMFLVLVVFQIYLKTQFVDFFLEETYRTEQIILEIQKDSVDVQMGFAIELGSRMAVNEDLYQTIRDSLAAEDVGVGRYYLNRSVRGLSIYSSDILAMAIVTDDGLYYQYYRETKAGSDQTFWNSDDDEETLEDIYEKVMEKVERKIERDSSDCYVVSSEPSGSSYGTPVFHVAVPVIGQQTQFQKTQGVLVITYRMDFLSNFLNGSGAEEGGFSTSYITNEDGKIIYHSEEEYVGYISYGDENSVEVFTEPLEGTDWSLCVAVDKEAVEEHVNRLYSVGLNLCIILLLSLASAFLVLMRGFVKGIHRISTAMDRVREGDLDEKIQIQGEHEIWHLAIQYNKLVESLQEEQDRSQKEYRKKIENMKRANEAERMALESQINAHFLCNTLGAINYSAVSTGNEELSFLIRSLSNILRYTFSKSYQEVTIAQEIAWVDQYLYLQKYRLMDVFDYEIQCPDEYDAWPCCKLIFQPFVENSIAHGFEGGEKGGLIRLLCSQEEDRMKVIISDNGCGMTPEIRVKIQSILSANSEINLQGVGIGIQNAVSRMRMFFGERFEIHMESNEGQGTCFTFYLPIPPDTMGEDAEEREDDE